jgi:hypothetical protein
VIVPELVKIFNTAYTLHCNEIRMAALRIRWPGLTTGFLFDLLPGTEQNGYLDWHTWVIGIEYVE